MQLVNQIFQVDVVDYVEKFRIKQLQFSLEKQFYNTIFVESVVKEIAGGQDEIGPNEKKNNRYVKIQLKQFVKQQKICIDVEDQTWSDKE